MGCYINPTNCSKEKFLNTKGKRIKGSQALEVLDEEGFLPVCLVNNGMFTAAAVGYSNREVKEFLRPNDPRPKDWYKVAVNDLLTVSDLKHFL